MLINAFSKIYEPRRRQGQLYKLSDVLLFSILAILCGANSYRKIQRFIHAHRERLNEVFGLRWKRAPAHTSIRYIIQGLETNELEEAFRQYSQNLTEKQHSKQLCIALDGKQLRGSFDHLEDCKATHLISAFCQEEALILGHLEVDEKSNEIPAVQSLIKDLGLTQCLFTIDAMHCQKKTFEIIKDTDNDLVVQVKNNQSSLFEAVKKVETLSSVHSTFDHYEHTRNRMTIRDVTVFEAQPVLESLPEWDALIASVIRVDRTTDTLNTRTKQWNRTFESAYYVSNRCYEAIDVANAIRGHWGIENRTHYVRDVTLKEDASRIRKKPGIFARLRSFALNILRNNQIINVSEALFDNALNLDLVFEYQGVF